MHGFNKVIIVGTLGSDPKPFTSREGKEFTSLSLATNRFWRNKDGVMERRTDWHRVMVWGKKATICQEHLKKGSAVCVEGYLTSYETEEGGLRRWQTSITAEDVNFLTRPASGEAPATEAS